MIYTLFDADGRMHQTVSGPYSAVIEPTIAAWRGAAVQGEYDDTYWLYGGVARKRPACPAELDGMTLRGVRPGSTIIINGQSYDCLDGGDVELEFDQPGIYSVRVVRWPYLDGEYTVENPAP